MPNHILNGMVVGFSYCLRNELGEILEESKAPMEYLHGYKNIIPGLEKEFEGLKIGDKKSIIIPPSEGYGEYDENLIYQVSRDNFPPDEALTPGMKFNADQEGEQLSLFIQEVVGEHVILNGNHPLAGVTLKFDVEIHSIREADPEELAHGHSHGAHGHHDH